MDKQLQNLIDSFAADASTITSKAEYKAHCKAAMANLRDWVKHGWICIRYVVGDRGPTELSTQLTPSYYEKWGLGLAFFGPDGTLYAGGSTRNRRDAWNKYMGQWRAVRRAIVIPPLLAQAFKKIVDADVAYQNHGLAEEDHLKTFVGAGPDVAMLAPSNASSVHAMAPGPLAFLTRRTPACLCSNNDPSSYYCENCGKLYRSAFPLGARLAVLDAIGTAVWCAQNRGTTMQEQLVRAA